MGGHPLPAQMVLHHGFEWRQERAYARYRSYASRSAAYHDVKGEVTPESRPAAEAIFSLRMRISSLKGEDQESPGSGPEKSGAAPLWRVRPREGQ